MSVFSLLSPASCCSCGVGAGDLSLYEYLREYIYKRKGARPKKKRATQKGILPKATKSTMVFLALSTPAALLAISSIIAGDAHAAGGASKYVFASRADARDAGESLLSYTRTSISFSLSLPLSLSLSLSLSPPLPCLQRLHTDSHSHPSLSGQAAEPPCPCEFVENVVTGDWTYGTPACPQCECDAPPKECPSDPDASEPSTAPLSASAYNKTLAVADDVIQRIPKLSKSNTTAAAAVVAVRQEGVGLEGGEGGCVLVCSYARIVELCVSLMILEYEGEE